MDILDRSLVYEEHVDVLRAHFDKILADSIYYFHFYTIQNVNCWRNSECVTIWKKFKKMKV